MRTFISFEEARSIVLSAAVITETEVVSFEDALGRTLREDVRSLEPVPHFDNSAMDGYAVRYDDSSEAPVTLSVVSDIPAGAASSVVVGPGQAARIMTGAPVPSGADAVVPVEKTSSENRNEVVIREAPRSGAHIRYAGEEIKANDLVLLSGLVITPPVIGMLASLGKTKVEVSRKPRLAIISTGDEVISADQTPGPGQLRNSNGPSLAAQALAAGAEVSIRHHLPDDPAEIRSFVESITDVDLIVFSGGVSMGEFDFVRTELDAMGATWEFWKVKQRPGKPLAFGSLDGIPVLGLPGNPVSSSISFEVYVRPFMATMLARTQIFRAQVQATLIDDIPTPNGLHSFIRGVFVAPDAASAEQQGCQLVKSTGNQASSMFTSMVTADCIIHLHPEMTSAVAGTSVTVDILNW